MVITRQGNYTPDKNWTSISSEGDGGKRQLPRRQLPRLLGRQPILPLPSNVEEEPVALAIDFSTSSLNFNGDGDGNNNNGGDSAGARGKCKRGMDEEEMEEEVEEVDKAKEEGWQRLSRKS